MSFAICCLVVAMGEIRSVDSLRLQRNALELNVYTFVIRVHGGKANCQQSRSLFLLSLNMKSVQS